MYKVKCQERRRGNEFRETPDRYLGFPICVLWLSAVDTKTVHILLFLEGQFSLLFCMLCIPFPISCSPLPMHSALGHHGESPGVTWAACVSATAAASPAAPTELLVTSLPLWPTLPAHGHCWPPKGVGRKCLRHGARCQIHSCSTMYRHPWRSAMPP